MKNKFTKEAEMAQIQITADTETKTLTVTINGTPIPDVADANVYSYRDSNGNVSSVDVSVYTDTQDEGGVSKRVSYHAYGSEKAERALASGQKVYKDVEGFIGIDSTTQAAQDVDDFLSSRKRGY